MGPDQGQAGIWTESSVRAGPRVPCPFCSTGKCGWHSRPPESNPRKGWHSANCDESEREAGGEKVEGLSLPGLAVGVESEQLLDLELRVKEPLYLGEGVFANMAVASVCARNDFGLL